jgi:hypothetical protein
MHIALWTGGGLILLVILIAGGTLLGPKRGATASNLGGLFTGIWLIAAVYNAYDGWANHGIPVVNEVAAFVPIFGIPAAAAWFWSRRMSLG